MNFSRKGTAQKEKDIKSTGKRLSTKTGVSIFRIIIVSLVALIIIGCFAGYGAIKGIIDKAPDISDIGLTPTGYKTTIYDIDGNEMDALVGAEANRIYVQIEDIPQVVQDAFVAIEDERFYEHNGIDIRGIFRAFFQGLSNGGDFNQGASTITQQLIKNQVFGGGNESNFLVKLERKIQEQYLAIKLESLGEKTIMKKEILERYLNTINCGQGTFGVQTASKRYFNKDVSDLTLSEAAVLAVITNRPVYYNPINFPEDNAARRLRCLDKMLEHGYCTQEEYDEAIADTDAVYERIQAVNEEYGEESYNSYFVDAIINQALEDLVSIGYTQSEASNLLYTGGLSIYSTQDTQIQNIVDEVYSDESFFPTIGVNAYYELTYALSVEYPDGTITHYQTNHLADYFKDDSSFSTLFVDKEAMQAKIDEFKASVYDPETDILHGEKVSMTIQPQSSFVVIDQATGYVSALIGGRGEKNENRSLNRATSSPRQPGSTFKILSTYLPALDTSGLTLATTFDDDKFYYPGSTTEVKNYDTSRYKGLTTIREAIAQSMNIIAVKTLEAVTPQVGYDYLLKLGFTTLVDNNDGSGNSDIVYPLALGGITNGVTNLELTAAYAAIANGGTYKKPTLYTKIVDHNGNVLIDKTNPESEQVMKESTAWLLTNAMKDVVTSGTGKLCKFTSINMPVAGKTGTTSKNLDTWFAGYTPYYTASIWSGFDNNNLSQTEKSYHKIVWREIMERIHKEKNLETKDFERPDSIITASICTKSGKLAVDGLCNVALGGSTVKTEYFAKGTIPTEKCDVHVKVKICKESGLIANEFCPEDEVEEIVYLNKGQEVTTTDDTKYLPPTKECTIHNENNTGTTEEELPEDFLPPDVDDSDNIDSIFPNIPGINNGNTNNGNTNNGNTNNGNTNNGKPNNGSGNNNNPGGGTIVIPTIPPASDESDEDDTNDSTGNNTTPEQPNTPVETPDEGYGDGYDDY